MFCDKTFVWIPKLSLTSDDQICFYKGSVEMNICDKYDI